MWIYRLGLTRAKEYALTGKPFSGKEAAEIALINRAVPFAELESEVRATAESLASVPPSQLAAMKLVVNQAFDNMGLGTTQVIGPVLDGLMRNTPDALRWIEVAEREGVSAVAAERDRLFADYSAGPRDEQPDPRHVIQP
jgi:enoyl-CoA hydratase